jgi:hypothetical protein
MQIAVSDIKLWDANYRQADPPINITVVNGDWVIDVMDVSHLNDTQAQAYAIADNRASDTATNDDEQLALLLQQLQQEDEALLQATGYNSNDLDNLLSSLADININESIIDRIYDDDAIIEEAFNKVN